MDNEIELTFAWTNNETFRLEAKENLQGQPEKVYTVIEVDENTHLVSNWLPIAEYVERFVKAIMAQICLAMKEA